MKIVARFKRHSGNKRGLPKSTAGQPGIDSAEANRGDSSRRTSGRTIWIAAPVAAVIIAATGLGIYFLNSSGSAWNAREASVAEKYRYLYDRAELEDWLTLILELAEEAERVHVVFNN